MNAALDKIRNAGAHVWLRFLTVLNSIAIALLSGVSLLNASYPQLMTQFLGFDIIRNHPLAALAAAVIWCTLVQLAINAAHKKVS